MEEISKADPERMKAILWGGYHHDPTGLFVHYAGTVQEEEPGPCCWWVKLSIVLFLCVVDGMEFMNHSTDDNIGHLDESSDGFATRVEDECQFALRDIKSGEELYEDYSTYNCHRVEWLAELYKEHCPERHEFEQSIARNKE
jgi:hypothetical protein